MNRPTHSTARRLLSAAMVALIAMVTVVQFHHHCECRHHSTPIHEHHCALHIDDADHLRYDTDIDAVPPLHIDTAFDLAISADIVVAKQELATYYTYPPLTHTSYHRADITRRGPPSLV